MKPFTDFISKVDLLIFIPALLLSSFGLLMIFSLSFEKDNSIFYRQIFNISISILVFFLISRINFRTIIQYASILYVFVILLLLLTIFFGNEVGGAVRWMDLGFVRIQASEIAKPVLVLVLSIFLANHSLKNLKNLLLSLAIVLLPAALIIQQPDLGSSVIIILIWVFMVFLAGLSLPYILMGFAGVVLFSPLIWNLLKDYQKERILTFVNPNLDPLGSSYNAVQALIAFGSGQITGRGLGRGTQAHLDFLPAESTDFIFAFIGEELGILGIGILVFIFFFLIYRIIKVANSFKSLQTSLFIVSSAFVLFIQFFINSSVSTGLFPVTGITLPFVSFGGSSMVSVFAILGLVNSIENTYSKNKEDLFLDG